MKQLLLLLVSVAFLIIPAHAEASPEPVGSPEQTETFTTQSDDTGITINVTVPTVTAPEPTAPSSFVEESQAACLPYTAYTLDETPVTFPADKDAYQLPELLEELFGTYQPRTQTVTEHLSDGSSVTYQQYIPGVAGMDIEWLASVGLFALFLFCVMKVVGGLLKL